MGGHRALEDVFAGAAATGGLVMRRDLRAAGVSQAALARAVGSGQLVRVRRRVYARAPLPARPRWWVTEGGLSPEHVTAVRADLMSWSPSAAAIGRTAALLRGWGVLVEPRKHELAVRHGNGARARRRRRDLLVRQVRQLRVEDVVPALVAGAAPLSVVPAVDVVVDALLRLPPLEAVVLADSALRAGDVTLDELAERAAVLPGRRQGAHARRLLEWCDDRSGSVLESVLRFRLLEAGVAGFTTQRVIRHRGQHVLRADFCFEEQGLVVEVDGVRWHPDPTRDRRTDNALVRAGWRVLRFSWTEVVHEPEQVLAVIRDALSGERCAA